MEKENINNNIEDDLNRRNRNWDKISSVISDVDGLTSDVSGLSSNVNSLISYVGDLETLTTDEKSNIVGALNEIDSNIKSHLAESATWIRIDNLSAPAEVTEEDNTIVPLSFVPSYSRVCAIKFSAASAADPRRTQFAIVDGLPSVSLGTTLACAQGGTIFTCDRRMEGSNLVLTNKRSLIGASYSLWVWGVWILK